MPVLLEKNIPGTVNFMLSEDLESKSTPGSFSISSTLTLTGTTIDVVGTIYLINYYKNLPSTLNFIGNDTTDIIANIDFFRPGTIPANYNLPVTLNFIGSTQQNSGNISLPSYLFLGNLNTDIPANVSFVSNSTSDFNCILTIQNNIAPDGNYIGNRDFSAIIKIDNNYLGAIGILVQLKSISTGNTIFTITDATGYFEFINLTPGEYILTPVNPTVIFSPNSQTFTITNQNYQTTFTATGNLASNNPNAALQTTDQFNYVNQNYGNSGTFSIEGFITLNNDILYTDIITVITEEDLASSFRQVLGS